MLGKYINQFMADNELSVNEEFFIENMDGNRVLIGCADRYKIEDVDGGILTAAVMNEKDKPPAMLLEAALIDLLRENYLVKKKPFYPVVGEYYYYISPSGNVIYANFTGCAEDLLLCKYIGVYKTEEAARKKCFTVPKALGRSQKKMKLKDIKLKRALYEKLLDALKAIRDECAKCTSCMDCPFHLQVGSSVCCGIHYGSPVNWKLNKVHVIRLINQ